MGIRAAGDCGRANIRLLPAHVAANKLNRPRLPSTEKTSPPVSRPWPTGYNLVSHVPWDLRKIKMYLFRLYLSLVKMGHTCSMRMVHLYLADGTFVPSGSLAPNRHGAKGPGCTWIVCDVDHLRSDFRTVSKPGTARQQRSAGNALTGFGQAGGPSDRGDRLPGRVRRPHPGIPIRSRRSGRMKYRNAALC